MRNEKLDAFVQEVDARTDILQVVQSYVPMKRRGGRYWGCCPFHHEKTPSFSVVPDKGFFYCFGCHAGGNAFKFLSLIENVSYFDAIKMQAEKLGIPMPARERTPEQEARDRQFANLRKVNQMARDFFHNCLTMTHYGEPGKAYFAGRGISDATIEEFGLGFAPAAWDKLTTAFLKRGVPPQVLLEAGLAAERRQGQGLYDRFRGRVIIPIADIRGRVVGFGGRVLDDSKPKYLNTPETILFNKRKLLFGLDRAHRAIQDAGYAIVVEGYMDAISVFGAGVENVVATLGTAFTADHAKLLMQYLPPGHPVICFCYDSDAAGQNATIRALAIIQHTGAEVRVIVVPDGKDPDEYIRKHGADAFRSLAEHAQGLFTYRLQYVLRHVDYTQRAGKEEVERQMAPVILSQPTKARLETTRRLAQILMLDEGIVRADLQAAGRRAPEPENTGPTAAQQRQPVRKVDDAAEAAGRVIIRMAWNHPDELTRLRDVLPTDHIPSPVQQEILRYLQDQHDAGRAPTAVQAAADLSDAAGEKLTEALTEDVDPSAEAQAYRDSVSMLRKSYFTQLIQEHSRRATEAINAKDNARAEAELKEVKRITELRSALDADET